MGSIREAPDMSSAAQDASHLWTLHNCRYYDQLTSSQNPGWVPAAGTGTMDKQKRFPRPQMTQQWEPQSNSMQTDEQKKAHATKLKPEMVRAEVELIPGYSSENKSSPD